MQIEMSPQAASKTTLTRRRRRRMSVGARARPWWSPRGVVSLLALVLVFSGTSPFGGASCEPAAQRGQQQSYELAGLQDASQFAPNARGGGDGGGGDGASFGEALAGNFKLGPYTNAKRARKMSAFMPMRGRKDGRDLVGLDSLRDLQLRHFALPQTNFNPVPPSQHYNSLADQLSLGPMRESDPNDPGLVHLLGGSAPKSSREFFNQLQTRALFRDTSRPSSAGLEQVAVAGAEAGSDRVVGVQTELAVDGNRIVQAKLRRAFHPMRGKKAPLLPLQLDSLYANLDQYADEL